MTEVLDALESSVDALSDLLLSLSDLLSDLFDQIAQCVSTIIDWIQHFVVEPAIDALVNGGVPRSERIELSCGGHAKIAYYVRYPG